MPHVVFTSITGNPAHELNGNPLVKYLEHRDNLIQQSEADICELREIGKTAQKICESRCKRSAEVAQSREVLMNEHELDPGSFGDNAVQVIEQAKRVVNEARLLASLLRL